MVAGLPPPAREKVQAEGAVGASAGCEGALMGMKVIFLDIDGVLNCDRTPNPRKCPYVVDRRLLARLKKLLKRTRAKVVLSSSWRLDPVGLLAAKYWGVPFIDTLADLPKKTRRDEVLSWLEAHPTVT